MILFYIFIVLISLYSLFIIRIVITLGKDEKKQKDKFEGKISILIPFRDEEKNIKSCLESILNQSYKGEFELILINDHSEDNYSSKIPKSEKIDICHLSENESGKKQALAKGISIAKGKVIVTTDADCIVSENWLSSIAENFSNPLTQMSLGEVYIEGDKSLVSKFQTLESMILGLFTKYGVLNKQPILATGANMAYRKSAFEHVKGFSGNENVSSGDDMFLLEKIKNHFNDSVIEFHNASVKTSTEKTFKSFLNQRVRWFKKMEYIKELRTNYTMTFIALANSICLLILIFPKYQTVITFLFVALKFLTDIWLLSKSNHVKQRDYLITPLFFIWNLIYPTIILIASVFSKLEWKGRKIS